jgi:hypothetical protein
MEDILKETAHRQRAGVARMLHGPLAVLAHQCVAAWCDRERLNQVLLAGFAGIPHCTYVYVVDKNGIQVCDNVGRQGLVPGHYGRDRSQRPYMREPVPSWGFLLSDAYVSLVSGRPSLTGLHVLRVGEELVGYVGADFDLRDLPMTTRLYDEPEHWRQIRGDPSIRGTVFLQSRVESAVDRNMPQAMSILEELFTERGMFHGVIHFSSSQAIVWTVDDPYRYRILDQDALADPDVCLAYPRRRYPPDALIPRSSVGAILECMQGLRRADDTFYLRSTSINVFNGMVSLTFSCDGSHYMRYDEFLQKNISFWVGSAA